MKTVCASCGTLHDDQVGCPVEQVACGLCGGTGLIPEDGHTYEMAPGGRVRCPGCLGTGEMSRPRRAPEQ